MRLRNHISLLALLMLMIQSASFAQNDKIVRSVIASVGYDTTDADGFYIAYTLGETFVAHRINKEDVNVDFTEGFHQPSDEPLKAPLTYSTDITEVQCPDVMNGKITVRPKGCTGPYTISMIKENGDEWYVDEISDFYTFTDLDSGTYQITVRGKTLCAERDTVRLVMKNTTCDVIFYTGITPNGDGKNDYWEIDNIEINQPNEVAIFNRWGTKVWQASNYNNFNVIWRGDNSDGQPLPSGTYYYTISISDNADASQSGWIQLTR